MNDISYTLGFFFQWISLSKYSSCRLKKLQTSNTDLSSLVATFKLSERATATIGGVDQQSSVTPNDFKKTAVYLITAENRVTNQECSVVIERILGVAEYTIANINPNPFSDIAVVEFSNSDKINHQLLVYIIAGEIVLEINNITSGQIEINKDNLPAGTYIVVLTGRNDVKSKRMIIQ